MVFIEVGGELPPEKPLTNKVEKVGTTAPSSQPVQLAQKSQKMANKPASSTKATIIDISDLEKWPKANLLKSMFGGRVEKVI